MDLLTPSPACGPAYVPPYAHRASQKATSLVADALRLRIWTGTAILAAWLISLGDGIITEDYHAFDVSTPVMVIYAGFLFGDTIMRKRYENGANGDNGKR